MLAAISVLCLCRLANVYGEQLEVVNQWGFLDFDFPFDYDYEGARLENTLFTGMEVTEDRIFLAMPRLRAGVPVTLATIPRSAADGSGPILRAYPDWSAHVGTRGRINCTGLVSVYRMKIDSCNRLWVLDSGVMTSLDAFTRVCQPKLVVFDLYTDQAVRTIILPNGVLRPSSLLTNLVVDESLQGRCDSSFVYMTDTATPALVVYDGVTDRAWRIVHPSMFPDPNFSDYTIDGDRFTLMDGIVGITHSPKLGLIYYQPLATNRIFSIPTVALSKGPPAEFEPLPVNLVGKKSSQGLGLALNLADETVYFSPLEQTSIASWNPVSNKQSLLAYDSEKLQFLAEMKWKEDGTLWALSTRFQKFFLRTVSSNEINLRVLRIPPTSDLQLQGLSNNLYS